MLNINKDLLKWSLYLQLQRFILLRGQQLVWIVVRWAMDITQKELHLVGKFYSPSTSLFHLTPELLSLGKSKKRLYISED